jgi:hypothetical protein
MTSFYLTRKEKARNGVDDEEKMKRRADAFLSSDQSLEIDVDDEENFLIFPFPLISTTTTTTHFLFSRYWSTMRSSVSWATMLAKRKKEKEKEKESRAPSSLNGEEGGKNLCVFPSYFFRFFPLSLSLFNDGCSGPGQALAHRRPSAIATGRQRPVHRAGAR